MVDDSCAKLQARGGWAEDAALHRCSFPIGPRNVISNLAYLAVGANLAERGFWAMGIAMTVLALGSGIYHGWKTLWANKLDWVGMYMVFGCLVVHAIVPASTAAPWLMLAFGAAVALYYSYELNGIDLNAQMGLFLFLSLLPALWGPTPHVPMACAGFATFLVAYGVWQLDVAHSKWVGLWGHAIWHVLTAIAIGLVFLSVP